MKSDVSVVIPTYRAAGFIAATLGSVAAQTRPPAEVVVADDGSPDGTTDAVADWARTAPFPVRVVRLPRNTGGPATPLNVGVRAARGDLIATLDHDDEMLPDKLECQVRAFAAAPDLGMVFHAVERVGSDHPTDVAAYLAGVAAAVSGAPGREAGPGVKRVGRRDAHALLAGGNYTVSCSTMMFPKRVWADAGGFEPWFRAACDYAFVERVARRRDVAVVDRPLVRWHRHPGTLTSSAGVNRSILESWRVLVRIARRLHDPAFDARVADLTDDLLGWAYQHRSKRQLRAALSLYGTLLRHRPSVRTAVAAAKVAFPARRAAAGN